jgi:signal transduction histidine kinase
MWRVEMLGFKNMQPNLAQVLNTLAHEIRTPLAVSQGYLKLYLDGRLTNAEDTRKAFEQTRQALGTLAALCVDMGMVGTLSESDGLPGIPERVTAADFVQSVRDASELAGASWSGEPGADAGHLVTAHARDLARAVAIVAKAAFDEARGGTHAVETRIDGDLFLLAGTSDSISALGARPDAAGVKAVDFVKGGKGLKLIWAAFVLDKHGVQTWTHSEHRASVAFRIPLVHA